MGQSDIICQPHLIMYSFVFLAMTAAAMAAPQQVPYVHQEIPAEPYIHDEIAAEPYIHIEPALTPEALGNVACPRYSYWLCCRTYLVRSLHQQLGSVCSLQTVSHGSWCNSGLMQSPFTGLASIDS